MEIKFFCPRWGFENTDWDVFLSRVKEEGYDGVEWFPGGEACNYNEVVALMGKHGLDFCIVMAILKPYTTVQAYLEDFQKDLLEYASIKVLNKRPLFITAQTGREFFNAQEIDAVIEICKAIEIQTGVPVNHETHRNKWAFAAHMLPPVLQRHPDLQITLDVSHWFCVSESYLQDQQEAVAITIEHTRHIHARVGHTEGPQVFDPALDEYREALEEHLKIWDRYIELQVSKNQKSCTITPEFGPPPYLVTAGRTHSMQDEQWRLNAWVKNFLKDRYSNLHD